MLLGETTTTLLSPSAYATLPFWPLLGALLVGLLIVLRLKPQRAALARRARRRGVRRAGRDAIFRSRPTGAPSEGPGGPATSQADPGFTYTLYNWMSFGDRESLQSGQWIAFNFYFDRLTGMMLLFVTVVSLIIVIYSIGYMRDHHGHPERGYERFFAFLGLFVFSMSTLVLAGNFILLYLGWELVGLCSYLLIGFYYQRPSAAAAAKKAFIVNRIGDFGFALGILRCTGSCTAMPRRARIRSITRLCSNTPIIWRRTPSPACRKPRSSALLLLCGAVGKSAQFPLYVWLPDAMEGPTPVSALIHAATMVTAGVYMVARCTPIFAASPVTLDVIVTLGGDRRRADGDDGDGSVRHEAHPGLLDHQPARFHVRRPGLSGARLGASSTFHARLLQSPAVPRRRQRHARHGRRHRHSPVQRPAARAAARPYWTMLVGCLALAGFPLLSGFWSKDEIVHAAFERNTLLGVVMLLTAGLTAYYTFRMFFLCFHGRAAAAG